MMLELNTQETNVLIQLIDLAVKAGGLQVAEAGVVLSKRITAAQQKETVDLQTKVPETSPQV